MFKEIEIKENFAEFKLHGCTLLIVRKNNVLISESYNLYLSSNDFSIFRPYIGGIDNEDFDRVFNGSSSDTGKRPRITEPELIDGGFKLTVDGISFIVCEPGYFRDYVENSIWENTEYAPYSVDGKYTVYREVTDLVKEEEPYATIKLQKDGVLKMYEGRLLIEGIGDSSIHKSDNLSSFIIDNTIWVITIRKDYVENIYYDYEVYFTIKQRCGHTVYILRKKVDRKDKTIKMEID